MGMGSTQPVRTFILVYATPLLQHQAQFGLNAAVVEAWRVRVSAAGGDAAGRGPDTLRPATSRSTWCRGDAVRLCVDTGTGETAGALAEPPVSVVTAFRHTVSQYPHQTALGSSSRRYFVQVPSHAHSFISFYAAHRYA